MGDRGANRKSGCIGEQRLRTMGEKICVYLVLLGVLIRPVLVRGADKFTTIYSSRVLSQSLAWIAQDAGLFKKYNIDHNLVFIASSSIVTAALLGSDPDMTLMEFLHSTYVAAANLAKWDRGALECEFGKTGKARAI